MREYAHLRHGPTIQNLSILLSICARPLVLSLTPRTLPYERVSSGEKSTLCPYIPDTARNDGCGSVVVDASYIISRSSVLTCASEVTS